MSGETTITIIGNLVSDPVATAVRVTEFWRLVDQRGDADCWHWTGYINDDGYGEFYWLGKMHGAHELAVTFTTGEVRSPGLDTCHSCDIPPCCNPAHVRFGSRASNVAEMVARDRVRAGERHPASRLTEAQVVEMRIRRANGAMQKRLAADYGISEAYVSEIVLGRRWQRVGGPIAPAKHIRGKAS